MTQLIFLKNPLKPFDTESINVEGRFLDWLTSYAPSGFGAPIQVFKDGELLEVDQWDFETSDARLIVVAIAPATAAQFIQLVVQLVVAYIIGAVFGPDLTTPSYAEAEENTVYSISAKQNAAKVGGEIPINYGLPIITPDYASQPYAEYTLIDVDSLETETLNAMEFLIDGEVVFVMPGSEETEAGTLYYTWAVSVWDETNEYWNEQFIIIPGVTYTNFGTVGETYCIALSGLADFYQAYTWEYQDGVSYVIEPNANVASLKVPVEDRDNGDGEQYLYYLLSLGIGQHELEEIYLGDTKISDLSPDVVEWMHQPYVNHQGQWDYVASEFNFYFPDHGDFYENVYTSLEVGSQVLDDAMSTDYFTTGTAPVNRIAVDLSFDQGFYSRDENGDFILRSIQFVIDLIDSTGARTSKYIQWATRARKITPLRRTFIFDVPAGTYKVAISRITPKSEDLNVADGFRWVGLRGYIVTNSALDLYSQTHLLAMRIRASETIAQAAQSRVRVKVNRLLDSYSGSFEATTNPSDIVKDIFTNDFYGGARPVTELDETLLAALYTRWDNHKDHIGFNGVFNGASTIYEAIKTVLAVGAAEPLPIGSQLSVAWDGEKPVRAQLFTEANITRGSFKLMYDFDTVGAYDGVQIEFREPDTWQPTFTTWPVGAVNAQALNLFGCALYQHAEDYAKYYWARQQQRRTYCEFQTELEGLICRAGDRIAVSHRTLSIAGSGLIENYDATTNYFTLDRNPNDFMPTPSGSNNRMVLRNEYGEPSELMQVIAVTGIVGRVRNLEPAKVTFPIYDKYSETPTHWAIGETTEVIRDFIVTEIQHDGDVTVTIKGVNYVDDLSGWGLPFLEEWP